MNVTGDSWRRLWSELDAQVIPMGLFNELVAAYSQRHRHYHTLQHLRECLAHFDAAASLARRPPEVEVALWFHDAVYDPRRDDNEEQSAAWAARSVRGAGVADDVAQRVADLVLGTKGHSAGADPDMQLLLDIDLSILGAAAQRFDAYEREVRAEYAHVPEADFRAGRARILAGFLARPHIFHTAPYREALEQRARDNIARSLARLQA